MKSFGKKNVTLEILVDTSTQGWKSYYFHLLPEVAIYAFRSDNWDVRLIIGFLCFRLTILLGK